MEKIMFKLPFGVLPGHWGLRGKTREIAKAEYELEGYELDCKLLEIKKDELTEDEFKARSIDIERKHGRVNDYEYKMMLTSLIKDDVQREIARLEVEYSNGKIGDLEFQKASANAKKEPWVTVLSMDFGGKSALEGSFELDWNEHFVEKLKAEGYQAPTPDAIVNQWFMEVCRNVALEEFSGTGDFEADSAANLQAVKRWQSESSMVDSSRKGYR
jgi:hypothetical protein